MATVTRGWTGAAADSDRNARTSTIPPGSTVQAAAMTGAAGGEARRSAAMAVAVVRHRVDA